MDKVYLCFLSAQESPSMASYLCVILGKLGVRELDGSEP